MGLVDPKTGMELPDPVQRQAPVATRVDDNLNAKVAADLGIVQADSTTSTALVLQQDAQVVAAADQHFTDLISVSMDDPESVARASAMASSMGVTTQQESGRVNQLLEKSIQRMAASGADGNEVATGLKDLRITMEDLDPGDEDFSPGWWSRQLGRLFPKFLSTKIRKYFMNYSSGQSMIQAIMESLRKGRETLERDNKTMMSEQAQMRELTLRLMRVVALGELLRDRLKAHIETMASDDPKRQFLEEQVAFPINQRVISLYEQMEVNKQGYLSLEVLINNNKELIRAVNDAENITINALRIAVMVAMALANQKLVLEQVKALKSYTQSRLLKNAQLLRTQGVAIQQQAVEGQLQMETLIQAFQEIKGAIEDTEKFRREALPRQDELIAKLGKLASASEESINKIEQGHRSAPVIDLTPAAVGA